MRDFEVIETGALVDKRESAVHRAPPRRPARVTPPERAERETPAGDQSRASGKRGATSQAPQTANLPTPPSDDPSGDGGADRAVVAPRESADLLTPDPQQSARAEGGGHSTDADVGQSPSAAPHDDPREGTGRRANGHPRDSVNASAPAGPKNPRASAAGEAVQSSSDALTAIDRFADPLIAEIVEVWRLRQDMVRAQQGLTLRAKAILRRLSGGDKAAAEKLWRAIIAWRKAKRPEGTNMSLVEEALLGDAPRGALEILPHLTALPPFEAQRAALERQLEKLGKRLPVAHLAEEIRGVGTLALAKIAAECGDLSAYEKGVSGVWKRAGLAVIDGERQRKKADAEKALEHGYSPARHAVFWNIGEALLKAQGTGEAAGPYRRVYDARKAYELARGQPLIAAHKRAARYMLKRLLRDVWRAWREARR